MKQELIITSAIAALLATSAVSATAKNATLLSPSGNISVAVEDAPDGNLTFSISANGEKLLLPSQIAMDFEGGKKARKIKSTSIKKDIKESFDAPFYRNPHFTTQCNELTVQPHRREQRDVPRLRRRGGLPLLDRRQDGECGDG